MAYYYDLPYLGVFFLEGCDYGPGFIPLKPDIVSYPCFVPLFQTVCPVTPGGSRAGSATKTVRSRKEGRARERVV